MRCLAVFALVAFVPAALGQDDGMPAGSNADGVYFSAVDVAPELVGGLAGLNDRLVYPESARADGVEGVVVVQFVVLEDGAVDGIDVLRSPDDRLTEAALEAVRASRFEPGSVGGEPVPVRFALPVMFRLSGEPSDAVGANRQGVLGQTGGVTWDADYGDLEGDLDHRATAETALTALVMGGVAFEGETFPGLAPGLARARFTVSDEGRPTEIEIVEAASPALERFVRFRTLASRFDRAAAGRAGTLAVTVLEAGR